MIRNWLTRLYIRIADKVLNLLMANETQTLQPSIIKELYGDLFIRFGVNKILSFAYLERQYDAQRFQLLYVRVLALYMHHRQSHTSQFYHWYSWLFGHTRDQKISAAIQFKNAILQGNDVAAPSSALTSGVLGKIYQQRHHFFSARRLAQARQQALGLPQAPRLPRSDRAAFSRYAAG